MVPQGEENEGVELTADGGNADREGHERIGQC